MHSVTAKQGSFYVLNITCVPDSEEDKVIIAAWRELPPVLETLAPSP